MKTVLVAPIMRFTLERMLAIFSNLNPTAAIQLRRTSAITLALTLSACINPHLQHTEPTLAPPKISVPATPSALPAPPSFSISNWQMLPDWQTQDISPSWPALLQSCRALKAKPYWKEICASANQLKTDDNVALHTFYQTWFTPFQVHNPDGSEQGMITGYYEPKLYGSRTPTERFKYPLYAVPDDMLTIDLSEVYPQLKGLRLRGRLQGKRVVPYYSRTDIDNKVDSATGSNSLAAQALFWVDDEIDLFFLQIEGSGRIELPDGSVVKVGYADQNGHPYVSIGKKLVDSGELKLSEASMQGIKKWAAMHPDKLTTLLNKNPSYVFFRELPDSLSAPLGALGVPLTEAYSLAVDPHAIPLGLPVFLATTYPNTPTALNRLMFAQDTGGAIRGAVRADFFWGYGETAANQAGKMKQQGRMWVLFPKGEEPASN